MTELIILGFLTKSNMTGYDIKQKMIFSTSNFIDSSYGSIYPALKKLEQKKLISSEELIEGGKIKKVYSITDEGKEVFLTWLASPIEASKTSITGALSKIFFFDNLPSETVTGLLSTYLEEVAEFKKNLLNVQETAEKHADPFELCTLKFGLDFYDFTIQWYKNYLEHYNKKQ